MCEGVTRARGEGDEFERRTRDARGDRGVLIVGDFVFVYGF